MKTLILGWLTTTFFAGIIALVFALVLLGTGIWIGIQTMIALVATISIITHRTIRGGPDEIQTTDTQLTARAHREFDWREG